MIYIIRSTTRKLTTYGKGYDNCQELMDSLKEKY